MNEGNKNARKFFLAVIAGVLLTLVVQVASEERLAAYCSEKNPATGVVVRNSLQKHESSPILVSPRGSESVLLLGRSGTILHNWRMDEDAFIAYLQPDGHLFAAQSMPLKKKYPGGGSTGRIREFSWEGAVVWEYEADYMHHDFDVMPDGGVVYIRSERVPDSFARNVRGGLPNKDTSGVWTDAIVVVNRSKDIVWEWHMYEHLDPREYPVNDFASASDWSHANSLQYVESNPFTQTPAFLISVRHISRVLLVDAQSGELIWESPRDMLSLQHDATVLENGNILVFDNGLFRRSKSASYWSRVVEIDPKINSIVWKYETEGTDAEQANNTHRSFFASSIMGAAQRLANGNTLMTSTTQGRIIEVAPDGRIVWDYFNEFRNENELPGVVFKARAYDPKDAEWGKLVAQDAFSKRLCSI